jgi:plasmid replication initiation protein
MFAGTGGSGVKDMPSSHSKAMPKTCVKCHMYKAKGEENKEVPESELPKGGHTFRVDDKVCLECHDDPKALAAKWEKEITPLLKKLKDILDSTEEKGTKAYKDARTNYFMVVSDGATGVHNPQYAKALLKYSISSLLAATVWK